MSDTLVGYLGRKSVIEGTAETDMPVNTLVKVGPIVAVTHTSFKAGDVYSAELGSPVELYTFQLSAAAASAIAVGTSIYINSDGQAVTESADATFFGYVWTPAETGATHVTVFLVPPSCACKA